MMKTKIIIILFALVINWIFPSNLFSQIGKRFPSERKEITDPVTGVKLIFLTSSPAGDSKIYHTHNQWTSDGNWIIFRSRRVRGEAMAVNEKSGDIVQVTEGGYVGTLIVARKSMKLYYMKRFHDENNPREIIEVKLDKLFEDSEKGTLKDASFYQRVCGIIPAEYGANGELAFDAKEEWLWFRVGKEKAMKYLPEGVRIEENFGPRNMGAGPGGIAGINIKTGEIKYVISVPFQVGHIQSNPWVPGQIIFCWETGGKSPQRTWIVNSDGTGLRPLYPEAPYEWITHEVVITPEEVAFAIMGHRKIPGINNNTPGETIIDEPGQEIEWGNCGTREKPTGLAIVNINSRKVMIEGQIPYGSGFWHVTGSPDGRFAAGDNFEREIYLIDRHSHEMMLLSAGHKTTAADHPHPSFSPDGTKILIQSAMISGDDKSMNICIIPLPDDWIKKYN